MLYVVVGGLGWIFYDYLGCIGVVILIEFNFEQQQQSYDNLQITKFFNLFQKMIILGCFVLISEFCAFGFFIYVQTSQQLMYILSNKMNNSYHTPNLPNNTPSFYSNFSSFIPPYDIISSHQPCLQPRPAEPYNQKQMKQLVEQIRFKEKMDIINKKKGKYKRSTNNCHKKYIGILKNLLFLKLDNENKEQLVNNYNQYRNSRVYYFIIMSYIKWCLCIADIRWIYHHFCKEVQNKMMRYKLEITTTNNVNFIHFRRDQIIEMNFSIKGINLFLMGEEQESIRLLYQKNKYIIIKKNQYLKTLQLIRQLGADLHRKYETLDLQKKVSQLKLHEVYQWKKEDTDKYNNFANISEEKMESISQEVHPRKRCDRKQEDDDWHQSSDSFQSRKKTKKAAFQPVLSMKKEMPRVKMEQPQIEQPIKNYPLIGLENSYPIVDFLTWHTWQLHKQKRFEFELKMRETMVYNQNFYIYFPLPTND